MIPVVSTISIIKWQFLHVGGKSCRGGEKTQETGRKILLDLSHLKSTGTGFQKVPVITASRKRAKTRGRGSTSLLRGAEMSPNVMSNIPTTPGEPVVTIPPRRAACDGVYRTVHTPEEGPDRRGFDRTDTVIQEKITKFSDSNQLTHVSEAPAAVSNATIFHTNICLDIRRPQVRS
ncbi:hypothetical protein Bbelb_353560 [Branchiostoma belcheri]|nr:hypothetical protein Bbelb_353560 [Branchiostoma belcheri]